MLGRCERVRLNVLIYHLLFGESINRSLLDMVNGWFYMTYALSFVKCDRFVCINGYKYLKSKSVFHVMMITDEIFHWTFKLCALMVIGMKPLCLGGIFKGDFTTAVLCCYSQFLV